MTLLRQLAVKKRELYPAEFFRIGSGTSDMPCVWRSETDCGGLMVPSRRDLLNDTYVRLCLLVDYWMVSVKPVVGILSRGKR